ncbi:DUF3106 domain-containing protein [Variovorax sp. J22R24]|uniref:DUF3106 domain-containing protein n=1 Tax=Variovorax gracilis TaxID=3053502 RepID=UPI002578A582|nr:DUF3106 domain-containing protein [Variovorax sp. J22R24]MDM0103366.1 DUF3106 domain-containing protein [Variovorax sp. J22R24]
MSPRPLPRAEALGLARSRPWTTGAWVIAGLLFADAGFLATSAKAQSAKPATSAAQTTAPPAKQTVSKPLWRDLTTRQQRALQPLAPVWDDLTEPHKRKWLAISRDYAKLPDADQEILHSRMTEWASLSNQQRAQARLNFADVKQVPVDERKAKWEAYQALSDEEKGKLAARATTSATPGAAPTIRPVPAQKLAPLPAINPDGQHTPRIQLAPPPAPVASARPPVAPPAPAPAFPPVSAEAQVPSPPAAAPAAELPAAPATPPVRLTEQPSSAP